MEVIQEKMATLSVNTQSIDFHITQLTDFSLFYHAHIFPDRRAAKNITVIIHSIMCEHRLAYACQCVCWSSST